MKDTKAHYVTRQEYLKIRGTLEEVYEDVKEWIKKYGPEARVSLEVRNGRYDSFTRTHLAEAVASITYTRPETPQEYEDRLSANQRYSDWVEKNKNYGNV